jgi:outer membrane protein OmpA-like peptidoglycan-associated protein
MRKFANPHIFLAALVSILVIVSCRSHTPRLTGYEMQQQLREDLDTGAKPVYMTGTAPVDSVNPNQLIFDLFRIDLKDYAKRGDSSKLYVYARVFDSAGHFVTNMGDPYKKFPDVDYFTSFQEKLGKSYRVKYDTLEQYSIREYGAGDSIPYNIAVTVDYSGSMDAVMPAIFEGTEIFVRMKFPYDNIALSSFNKGYDLKVPLMSDTTEILNLYNLRKMRGYGLYSAVYDAVDTSLTLFEDTPEDVPRVMVVFSDGDDNYSKEKIGALIAKAKAMNINIFTIGFGYAKDENLRQMAEYTGGKFYIARSKEELVSIFRDIYMSLRYYYLITYKPPRYWGWHTVYAGLNVPGMNDSLIAEGEYDTSDLFSDSGAVFEMPILFEFDSATISTESFDIIDQLIDQLQTRPRLRLEIQGHTDNVGTIAYNQDLSERRAKAVYDAIIERGEIDPRRLRYRGFGFSRPRAENETEEGRAQNRRTMFLILAK